MFADVQDYKLYKSSLDTKKERFANASELIDYQKKSFQNKIYETVSYVVGSGFLKPFKVPTKLAKRDEKNKMVSMRILGIPVSYKDRTTDLFTYEQYPEPLKMEIYDTSHLLNNDYSNIDNRYYFRWEDVVENKLEIELDFTVQTIKLVFYTTLDIASALGGIGATLKIVLGALVPVLTLRFMIEFSNIQNRKAK